MNLRFTICDLRLKAASALLAIFYLQSSISCLGQPVITNATMVTTWSDSFGLGEFGQRQNFFLAGYFLNAYPQFFVSYRDHSRSGDNNGGMVGTRMPEYGIPDAGASYGLTNGLNFFYVSGNGGFSSNTIYGLFKDILQYPTNSYTTNAVLTNDWPEANAQFLYSSIVIGDVPYRGGNSSSRDYSYGGRSAAIEDGVPFIDTWSNMIAVVTNNDFDSNILWFPNSGAFDHPNNVFQLIWTLTNLRSLGVDTNTFTAVIDFNAGTVSSTNHCTVTGITKTGSTGMAFTFHADHMAPGFWVPNGVVTNDCRGAFNLMPSLGNAFCEIWRITNLPTGTYNILYDGYTNQTTAAQLAAGYNWFTNYTNPLWDQKTAVLYSMCDMRDTLHSDASSDAHPGDNRLLENFESFARTIWPTNTPNVTDYISRMQFLQTPEIAQDIIAHNATQQTNHTVTISLAPARLAPFHK